MNQLLPRIYFTMRQLERRLLAIASAVSTGIWLGVLPRSALDAIDDIFYVGNGGKQISPIDYSSDEYNRSGLWDWENGVISEYFCRKGRLAVLGAGGGREVLALMRLGFEVDGWECQEQLVSAANRILTVEGFNPSVRLCLRDTCPTDNRGYSGVIIGWGAYTNIPGSHRRIGLLRAIRERLAQGVPILLSFYLCDPVPRRFYLTAAVANPFRLIAGREMVEVGDFLVPHYVHYFTESQVRRELEAAGFNLAVFRAQPFPHAVAMVSENGQPMEN